MITEYVKGNPTTIYDTNLGLYQTDYCDNIENIIQKENEIELIQEQIKELEETKNAKQDYVSFEYKVVSMILLVSLLIGTVLFMGPLIYAQYLGVIPQHIPFFISMLLICSTGIGCSWLPFRKKYQKAKKEIEALIEAIPELEKEIQQKEAELLKLKKESGKQESIEEKINMASFNQTYRQELEAKLDELMASKCNDKGISLGLSFKKPNN